MHINIPLGSQFLECTKPLAYLTYHPLLGYLRNPPLVAFAKAIKLVQCFKSCNPLDALYYILLISTKPLGHQGKQTWSC